MNAAFQIYTDQFAVLLAAGRPVIDTTYLILLVLRVLHIVSAIILVGGLFYIRSILEPAGVNACFADRRALWARWVAVASAFLLASGIYNYLHWIRFMKAAGTPLDPTYHMLMGIKMLLGLLVMFVAAVLAGKTSLADKFRGKMRLWLTIAWIASLGIVVLGAMARTYH